MKAQILKNWKQKAAVAGALMTTATVSFADGLDSVGTTAVAEINKLVPIISSIGLALLALYVTIKAFRLVSSFVGGR